MLGSRASVDRVLSVVTRRLQQSRSIRSGSLLSSRLSAVNQSLPLHHKQPISTQQRWYTSTNVVSKKLTKDEELLQEILDELPDIQYMNPPEGWGEKEVMDFVKQAEEDHEKEEAERFVPNWKPGMRKRPLKMSFKEEDFMYEYGDVTPRWTHLDKRCGMLAIKVGMLPWWDDWGERHACTLLFADQNVVVGHKTQDKHGYMSVQVAAGQRKRKNVQGQILGQYKELMENVDYKDDNPPYLMREFRVSDERWLIPKFSQIHVRHFVPGQNVDVAGISKGKGFQGPMKRWGFAGMPASHGVSKSHRAHGSTGACQDPGRVWKGKKMAGRMGSDRVTVQNLRVLKVDRGRNLLWIKGHVPGQNGNWVEIRDAIKKPLWETELVAPDPETSEIMMRPPLPTFAFDESIDGSGSVDHVEVFPPPKKDPSEYLPDEDVAAIA